MSMRNTRKETGKGGALVPAFRPAISHPSNGSGLMGRDITSQTTANRPIIAARSVFLAQLASQYEGKEAARARRIEVRAFASGCYSKKSPEPRLRHLTWA